MLAIMIRCLCRLHEKRDWMGDESCKSFKSLKLTFIFNQGWGGKWWAHLVEVEEKNCYKVDTQIQSLIAYCDEWK